MRNCTDLYTNHEPRIILVIERFVYRAQHIATQSTSQHTQSNMHKFYPSLVHLPHFLCKYKYSLPHQTYFFNTNKLAYRPTGSNATLFLTLMSRVCVETVLVILTGGFFFSPAQKDHPLLRAAFLVLRDMCFNCALPGLPDFCVAVRMAESNAFVTVTRQNEEPSV